MRTLCLLLMTGFPAIAAAVTPCTPAPLAPGAPIDAPHAVFEAYVVKVHESQDSRSEFGTHRTRRALVEVARSFHGPYVAGQQVETLTLESPTTCGNSVEDGGRVMVASQSGGPFEIVEVLPKGQVVPQGPFASLASTVGEPRRSRRSSLATSTLRGSIDVRLAKQLRARARPGPHEQCDITSDGNYAQVSWGSAFGGNDTRFKVIFERVSGRWVEILRYEAPTPAPARNRPRRAKQRAVWAVESGLRTRDAASAASTS